MIQVEISQYEKSRNRANQHHENHNRNCNDGSSSVHPGATESCNSIDDNCDGRIDEGCPGVEVCDGIDNDLDGQVDEGFPTGNTS